MATNIPFGEAGLAAFEASDTFTSTELFNSAIPHPSTESFTVPENTAWDAFTVVGLDVSNNLVIADLTTPVAPIGVTTVPVATGAGETATIAVYRSGNFNPAALAWHADYDTMAKKLAAFRGSPTPTNIIVRERL